MEYTYYIHVQRESRDDDYALHTTFDQEMTEDDIIEFLKDNDLPYLPDYERLTYYQI